MHENIKPNAIDFLNAITYDEIQECYARLRKTMIDECFGLPRCEYDQETKKQIKT